jgi:hypothetical protein
MAKYIEAIAGNELGPIDLTRSTAVVQLWAGIGDLLFRKAVIDIDSTEVEGDITMKEKWVFYDFNQPVEIPLP